MILAALSFFGRPRGAISSILLNRHSLFEHNVIIFPIIKYELALVLILSSSFGYEI